MKSTLMILALLSTLTSGAARAASGRYCGTEMANVQAGWSSEPFSQDMIQGLEDAGAQDIRTCMEGGVFTVIARVPAETIDGHFYPETWVVSFYSRNTPSGVPNHQCTVSRNGAVCTIRTQSGNVLSGMLDACVVATHMGCAQQ